MEVLRFGRSKDPAVTHSVYISRAWHLFGHDGIGPKEQYFNYFLYFFGHWHGQKLVSRRWMVWKLNSQGGVNLTSWLLAQPPGRPGEPADYGSGKRTAGDD